MADKIVAEYIVKTDQTIKNIDRLEKELKQLQAQGKSSSKDIESNFEKTSSSLISQFSKVGAALGVAFGAAELVSFGKEAVKLASQMEGVERAFKRIGGANSGNLLKGLRDATRGTVSDLVLMQKSVQASNFKIPLENLASLFKFAQARARETGESVEYLTNSIVLGIGRKSPLILDNLGISAVELRTRLKGVGVEAANVGDIAQIIGDIAQEELAKMGDQADTTADKFAKMQTSWENFKLEFGTFLISSGVVDTIKEVVDAYVIALRVAKGETLETITIMEGAETAIVSFAEGAKRSLDKLVKPLEDGKTNTEALTKANQLLAESQTNLNELINKKVQDERTLLLLEKELEQTNPFNKLQRIKLEKAIDNIKEKIALDDVQVKQMKAVIGVYAGYINSLKSSNDAEVEAINNLKYYNDLIAELQDKQKQANTTREEVRRLEDEINEAIRQRSILLGKLREVGGVSMQQIETIAASELEVQQQLTDDILADYQYRNGEIELAQDKLNKALDEKAKAQREKELEQFVGYVNQLGSILSSISKIQQNLNQEELNNLQIQLDEGIISREEYEAKRKEILRQQAEDQKTFAIFDAVIKGALAVVNALSEGGPILAAVVGAATALEIAAIASTPIPQFAEGGWVDSKGKIHGRKHAQGGVKIEAEGDEFIVKGAMAKQNAGLLEALNKGAGQEWINRNMVYPAIQSVLNSGLESNSGNWGNITASLKDHNLLHSDDRTRSTIREGFKFLAKELKQNNRRKRGGYDSV